MTAVNIPAIRALVAEARGWADSREGWHQYQHDLGIRLADTLDSLLALVPEPAAEDEVTALYSLILARSDETITDSPYQRERYMETARQAIALIRRPRPIDRERIARALYIEHKNRVEPAWGLDEPAGIWDRVIRNGDDQRHHELWLARADAVIAALQEGSK